MAMGGQLEVWRECADWLTRCGLLRPDHKANLHGATINDLAYTLRDGVLLCNLLNTLEPGCVDAKDVNQKPQMAQFLCLKNIKTFLQTVRDEFGLKDQDLFDAKGLFDLNDFYRVLNTLSKLSTCPKVQKRSIGGFSMQKHRFSHQEDIYKQLSSSERASRFNDGFEGEEEYTNYHRRRHDEEIYQDVIEFNRSPHQQVPVSLSATLEKRDFVVNELVETEKNYVDVLKTLKSNFMIPLRKLIRDEDFKIVFANIKELSDIHERFYHDLKNAISPSPRQHLSEVFLCRKETFLVYGNYIANLTTAQNLIQELCAKNDEINQEVERCQQRANNGKFKLADILSVPLQRILKYHLLLDKLVSETQTNHPDYQGLHQAKEAMLDVGDYINEVKRDSDTFAILYVIQKSISDWNTPTNFDIRDFGRLIVDGDVRIKAHDDQKQKSRYIFIFDTVMVMCKATKNEQYCYKESLRLAEYRVQDIDRRILTRDAKWSYQWFLVHKDKTTAYTCYTRTEEMKTKFLNAIRDALDNIEPMYLKNTDHKFHLTTFDRPTTCLVCKKFLKGKIYQGYKCERCPAAVHKACILTSGRCGVVQPRLAPPPPPPPPPRLPEPRPLTPVTTLHQHQHYPNYEELNKYLWFVGEMERDRAASLLENQIDGTYMLRIRPLGPRHPTESIYALSLKTDNKVKHMKVYEKDTAGTVSFYLSVTRFFKSIIELINYYQHASLEENFVGLDVSLDWPYKRIIAVAEFDFNTLEPNQLPLRAGCQVVIVSKEGDEKGWWKGKINNREGFFPKQYVREVPEV